jgi:hypothetical protein
MTEDEAKALKPKDTVMFTDGVKATVQMNSDSGAWLVWGKGAADRGIMAHDEAQNVRHPFPHERTR